MVHKWFHVIDWPRQKGIEPLFVMSVTVLNKLMKQSLNHRVHGPVSLRDPNKLTQQLNSGYSRQGKNRFGVPNLLFQQNKAWVFFVCWLVVFFNLRWGLGASYKNKLGENSYGPFLYAFLLHIKHMHAIQQTSGQTLRDTQRCPVQQLCWQTTAFSIIFSISSAWRGMGKPAKEHRISPLDYLIAAKATQWSTFITPKASDTNQLPCGGLFSQGHRALETTQSCRNKQLVFLLPAGLKWSNEPEFHIEDYMLIQYFHHCFIPLNCATF